MSDARPSPGSQPEPSSRRKPEAGSQPCHLLRTDGDQRLRNVLDLGPHLIEVLERRFPSLDPCEIEGVWYTVVLRWHEASDTSRDERDIGYFYMLTRRRLINLVSSERSRHDREKTWGQAQSSEDPGTGVSPETAMAASAKMKSAGAELVDKILPLLEPDQKIVFRLWLEGHTRTEVFAQALELPETVSPSDARKAVRKVKDRLRKRLCRDSEIKQLAAPLMSAWEEAREMGLRP